MRPPPLEHNRPDYDRPNQPWVCGLAAAGHACALGPNARGRCPALSECVPIRDGDRWRCNRAAVCGGPCEEGPMHDGVCGCVPHCTPVRSLRAKRGRFVAACVVATAAALILMLSADWRDLVIAPGPLTTQHAQLLRRPGTPPQCAACHAAAEKGAIAWTASLVTPHGDEPKQSQLCMKCHAGTIEERLAYQAHNVPAALLAQIRQGDKSQVRRGGEARRPGDKANSPFSSQLTLSGAPISTITCAACHREHHGAAFDLTAIDDAACQTCHRQRYESFATDHPDFGDWPYVRRTPIIFNHASHLAKHFPEKKQSFECRKCHQQDRTGATQLTASYEATCAACHDEKIATSTDRGVPMLIVPTLDVGALRRRPRYWPLAAGRDGRLRRPAAGRDEAAARRRPGRRAGDRKTRR